MFLPSFQQLSFRCRDNKSNSFSSYHLKQSPSNNLSGTCYYLLLQHREKVIDNQHMLDRCRLTFHAVIHPLSLSLHLFETRMKIQSIPNFSSFVIERMNRPPGHCHIFQFHCCAAPLCFALLLCFRATYNNTMAQ